MIALGFIGSIVLFVVKATGLAALSWLIVAAPLLAALAIETALFLVFFIAAVLAALTEALVSK